MGALHYSTTSREGWRCCPTAEGEVKKRARRHWWKGQPTRAHGWLRDQGAWLSTTEREHKSWIEALRAIEEEDDPGPLLLHLEQNVPREIFTHFEDLFERKTLTQRKRGKPTTPSYDRTAAEAWLELLCAPAVRNLMDRGVPTKDAIARVARDHDVPENILDNYFRGKRHSTRRMKRRRPRP